jgi:thymidylate synthase ThyX
MECTFHRFILPEVNTYRMWSRNAASSRAIPLKRRIQEVRENPAIPVHWGLNQRGMVAENELSDEASTDALGTWMEAALAASDYAQILLDLNLHKQTASRILEPFLWHTSVISATDFSNCFEQRIHPDAQPEFHLLASEMKNAIDKSIPTEIGYKQWHLPYLSDEDKNLSIDDQKKVCVARVARSSYLNQDKIDVKTDLLLYQRLASAQPPHLSPFEMIATPAVTGETVLGNFDGWHQMRHLV